MAQNFSARRVGFGLYLFCAAGNKKPLQVVCKGFVLGLQSGCRLSLSGGVFGVVGGGERVVGVGSELYHCEVCNIDKMFAIVVCSI